MFTQLAQLVELDMESALTMRNWHCLVMTLLTCTLTAGCGNGVDDPPVSFVKDDDPKMVAAIEKARASVDQFITALNDPNILQSDFSVKFPIKEGDQVEHIWVHPVRFENGQFIGNINNNPDLVTTVSLGDEVKMAKEDISDWMYVDDQKLIGGYTLRVLRDNLAPNEREAFDSGIPFKIE